MADMAIRALLGVDKSGWTKDLAGAEADAKKFGAAVRDTAAQVASLERAMRAGGGDEVKKQLKERQAELRGYQQELRRAESQKKRFDAALGSNPTPPKTPDPKTPPRKPGGGGHGEEGPGKGGRAEIAHSIRSSLDMIAAGQSPLKALQMESERIAQGMGVGMGGLIGIGIAGLIAGKISDVMTRSDELKIKQQRSLVSDPSQGIESVDVLKTRVADLSKTIEEARPPFTVLGKVTQMLADGFTSFSSDMMQFLRGVKPLTADATHPEEQRAELAKQQISLRDKYIGRIVEDARVQNDIGEDAYARGGTQTASEGIERQRQYALGGIEGDLGIPELKAEIKRITDDPNIWDADKQKQLKALQEQLNVRVGEATKLQDQANRHFDLEEKKAILAAHDETRQRGLKDESVLLNHPGIERTQENTPKADFDKDMPSKPFKVPAGMGQDRGVSGAAARYQAALEKLKEQRDAGDDDHAQASEVLQAEAELRDQVARRGEMSPTAKAAADRAQAEQDRAAARAANPETRDANRQGSAIHDASGPGGSSIPQAGENPEGAYSNPDNVDIKDNPTIPDNASIPDIIGQHFADIGNLHMPAPSHMQDRSFEMPAPDIGEHHGAGGGNADVVSAVKETTSAVKDINFKNR